MNINLQKNGRFTLVRILKWPTLQKCTTLVLCMLLSINLFAQTNVSGTVYETDGKTTLPGATVQVSGEKVATQTDADGKFSVTVASGKAKLMVSYVGMQTQTVDVNNQSVLSVTMQPAGKIDEVTVVSYASVKKGDLTGAAATVSAKDFNKGPLTSPDQLLQGKVAGVQMTNNSGQPGGASTVHIRGNSAITGSGQPLYVVDGVALDSRSARPSTNSGVGGLTSSPATGDTPDGNPLNFINPADIESMEILKDASATAIYGSRAAYGVILITTKRGKSGDVKLDVGASVGISNMARRIGVLDASQYRDALKQYDLSQYDYGQNVDALKAITQTGFTQNYNVGVSGGSNGNTFRVSLGYQNQKGIIKTSDFKKYSAGFTGSFKFLESKKLGLDVNMISSQYQESLAPISTNAGFQGNVISQALQWNPTQSLYNSDGTPYLDSKSTTINPLVNLAASSDKSKVTTVLGSISPYYKFTPWLEFRISEAILVMLPTEIMPAYIYGSMLMLCLLNH